jgi:hypothetical protein
MAIKGRIKKSAIKGDFAREVISMLGKSVSVKQATTYNTDTNMFRVISVGRVDKGAEMPRRGYSSFINNPINIKNAMLNPTENKIVSVIFNPRNLSILSIIAPGTNTR